MNPGRNTPKTGVKLPKTGVETAKTGVETALSQQLPKIGVETSQQLFNLSVNHVCLNSVSTLNHRLCGRLLCPHASTLRHLRAIGTLRITRDPRPRTLLSPLTSHRINASIRMYLRCA